MSHTVAVPRTKVLVVVESLEIGGAEYDILRNIPRIDRNRFDVQVAMFSHPGALAEQLAQTGILHRSFRPHAPPPAPPPARWFPALWRRVRRLRWAAPRIWWLNRVIADWRPDIIHVFLPEAYVYTTFAHLLVPGRRRLIMSRLNVNDHFKQAVEFGLLEPLCHRLLDVAVGNSRAVLRDLQQEGVPADKLFLLYNGIETDRFARPADAVDVGQDGPVTMTAVANLFTYKGHDDLLAALVLLKTRSDRPWTLLVAGRDEDGNLARYRAFCDRHGLADHVVFLGPCDTVAALLQRSQLHIHPSRTESLPNSIIEAMSAGLPVVGTQVGGIPELIVEGETGFLVPPADPPALAIAIERLITDAGLRRRFGARAQQRATEMFTIERSVSLYERLYSPGIRGDENTTHVSV